MAASLPSGSPRGSQLEADLRKLVVLRDQKSQWPGQQHEEIELMVDLTPELLRPLVLPLPVLNKLLEVQLQWREQLGAEVQPLKGLLIVLALQPRQQVTTARPAAVEVRRISRVDLPHAGPILAQQYKTFLAPGISSGTRRGVRGAASTGSCSAGGTRPDICNPADNGSRNVCLDVSRACVVLEQLCPRGTDVGMTGDQTAVVREPHNEQQRGQSVVCNVQPNGQGSHGQRVPDSALETLAGRLEALPLQELLYAAARLDLHAACATHLREIKKLRDQLQQHKQQDLGTRGEPKRLPGRPKPEVIQLAFRLEECHKRLKQMLLAPFGSWPTVRQILKALLGAAAVVPAMLGKLQSHRHHPQLLLHQEDSHRQGHAIPQSDSNEQAPDAMLRALARRLEALPLRELLAVMARLELHTGNAPDLRAIKELRTHLQQQEEQYMDKAEERRGSEPNPEVDRMIFQLEKHYMSLVQRMRGTSESWATVRRLIEKLAPAPRLPRSLQPKQEQPVPQQQLTPKPLRAPLKLASTPLRPLPQLTRASEPSSLQPKPAGSPQLLPASPPPTRKQLLPSFSRLENAAADGVSTTTVIPKADVVRHEATSHDE